MPTYTEICRLEKPKRKSSKSTYEIPTYNEISEFRSPLSTYSEVADFKKPPAIPDTYAVVDMTKKHNKTNYVELERFDDQRLTVMPVPVPEVTYSDVKVDLR
ncbi:uncharacterized protein [Dysidea avara]|uniref:uncharacterized protein isoform X1 n=1 Tax=Dysidea avara TaxID=196820 RepID=UPI003331C615